MDLNRIQRLQQQAAIARAARQQQNTHKAKLPDRPHGIASSYDADSGLDIIRLSDGSTSFALPDTSGVRSLGDNLVVRTGGGMTHVDALRSNRNLPLGAKRKLLDKVIEYPFKILFRVRVDDTFKFYIGGDRPLPLLIFEAPVSAYIRQIRLQSIGPTIDDWIFSLVFAPADPDSVFGGTPVTLIVQYGNDPSKSWSIESREGSILTYFGHGFWTSNPIRFAALAHGPEFEALKIADIPRYIVMGVAGGVESFDLRRINGSIALLQIVNNTFTTGVVGIYDALSTYSANQTTINTYSYYQGQRETKSNLINFNVNISDNSGTVSQFSNSLEYFVLPEETLISQFSYNGAISFYNSDYWKFSKQSGTSNPWQCFAVSRDLKSALVQGYTLSGILPSVPVSKYYLYRSGSTLEMPEVDLSAITRSFNFVSEQEIYELGFNAFNSPPFLDSDYVGVANILTLIPDGLKLKATVLKSISHKIYSLKAPSARVISASVAL